MSLSWTVASAYGPSAWRPRTDPSDGDDLLGETVRLPSGDLALVRGAETTHEGVTRVWCVMRRPDGELSTMAWFDLDAIEPA